MQNYGTRKEMVSWSNLEKLCSCSRTWMVRGVTGIFFWGGKVIFPDFFPGVKCFFPVENSHFGRPKTNFRRFQKWKAKKKKRSSPLFLTFSCFHFQFSTFSSQFSPLFPFFLASFFPIRQQKFPGQKSLGGHSAPLPPRLLRHCGWCQLLRVGTNGYR